MNMEVLWSVWSFPNVVYNVFSDTLLQAQNFQLHANITYINITSPSEVQYNFPYISTVWSCYNTYQFSPKYPQ